jgi:hypothetical protein
MSKEVIKVGIANEGETNLDIEVVKTWEPKNIEYIGTSVFFKNDKTYYSMTRENFKKIFNK